MKLFITLSLIIAVSFTTTFAQEKDSLASLEALNQAAKQKLDARPNVPLADETADVCSGSDVLEAGRIPNYARSLALLPEAAKPLAEAFKAYLYGGSIAPETKMAITNCGRLRPQNHPRAGRSDEGRLRGAGRRIQRAGRVGSVAAELQFRLYEPLHRRVTLAFRRRSDQNLSGDLR